MVWDFAEANPFCRLGGRLQRAVEYVAMRQRLSQLPASAERSARQADAQRRRSCSDKVVSTDPPYYDNIGYADLSDFFYVWLRRSLQAGLSRPLRHARRAQGRGAGRHAVSPRQQGEGETFFLDGMTQAMHRLAEQAHPAFPVTIYYAFKQSESDGDEGTASTGWETFLDAVIRAGFAISGTWPMRTERGSRMSGNGTNALASSIVLVCRPRAADAPTATRREFVAALKAELPAALAHLQRGNIAPVDLAQAAIGPGMAVYTRYAKVLDAEGKPLTVREALALINQTLDEALAEQEGDFDADSRWALAWFEQHGFAEGEFGVAETLSKAKNTSVAGHGRGGHPRRRSRGKVRLLQARRAARRLGPGHRPAPHRLGDRAPPDPRARERRRRRGGRAGRRSSARKAEIARELAYRLYTLCERKKRAAEALAYNGLVQSWPEIARLAREGGKPRAEQAGAVRGD